MADRERENTRDHIGRAKAEVHKVLTGPLEDPDLAHFVQGTPSFEAYIQGMLWAQDYALENRSQMMQAVLAERHGGS